MLTSLAPQIESINPYDNNNNSIKHFKNHFRLKHGSHRKQSLHVSDSMQSLALP